MDKKALIIFVRNPELGKVKTRLAATVGDEKALEIYKSLLTHTRAITAKVKADKFVFYFDTVKEDDSWSAAGFVKKLQADGDLGHKMKTAFGSLFQEGYAKVLIIGSDCFELNNSIIEAAFRALDAHQVVIGPATDGGYYLLGMKQFFPFIFEDRQWSTEHVFTETKQELDNHAISYALLQTLTDVDTEEDWLKTR
ncbi:MAG: glycosyltransferase [Chitinophagaceae bacterium]|nr:MAG: glycosyltransferase [Chitinophagaceae bacterium]